MPATARSAKWKRVGACALRVLTLILAAAGVSPALAQLGDGDDFVSDASAVRAGRVAPSWNIRDWINSAPIDLGELQGKVVLVRFFSDSPNSAAALNDFYRAYRDQGFVVVGIYTPQPMPAETDLGYVRRLVASLGFEFPVGVDPRWETLNGYWLTEADTDMGSASFLIDRKGVIRAIQGRGLYDKNSPNRNVRRAYETLQRQIETLLKESGPAAQ
jgi:peroxiredoxin